MSNQPPTLDDLYAIAHTQPAVYGALAAYQQGALTLQEALMVAVVALVKQLESTEKAFREYAANDTRPIRFP